MEKIAVHTQVKSILERSTATQAARSAESGHAGWPADHPRPLRALLVVECAGGGTGRHVLDLAEGLIARNCDVHMLYSTGRMDRMFETRLSQIKMLHRTIVPMRTGPHPGDFGAVRAIR